MSWHCIEIIITSDDEERLGDWFLQMGAASVTSSAADESEIFEVNGQADDAWSSIRLTALFERSANIDLIAGELVKQTQAKAIVSELEDQNWERSWLEHFKPLKINDRLWISPSWEQPVDETAITISIDPGMSFGTGTHESTRLCLDWLTQLPLDDKSVIDYGCGSGILAIAALKFGATRVLAVDIEPRSLAASLDNAKQNQVNHDIQVYFPYELPDVQADIVIANILAGTIIELAPVLTQHLSSQGQLLLSGILREQEQMVKDALGEFNWQTRYDGQWLALLGHK